MSQTTPAIAAVPNDADSQKKVRLAKTRNFVRTHKKSITTIGVLTGVAVASGVFGRKTARYDVDVDVNVTDTEESETAAS